MIRFFQLRIITLGWKGQNNMLLAKRGKNITQKFPIYPIAYYFKAVRVQKWYAFPDCISKRRWKGVKMIRFWWKRPQTPTKKFQFSKLRITSERFGRGNDMQFPIAYQNARSKEDKGYTIGERRSPIACMGLENGSKWSLTEA